MIQPSLARKRCEKGLEIIREAAGEKTFCLGVVVR